MKNNALISTATENDFSINFLKFGNGEKNLIIIPGISLKSPLNSANGLITAYKIFSDYFTVYFFDRKNNIPSSYSINEMSEDIYHAMQILNIESASVFGASQGGMISQCLAINHPEVVENQILGSTLSRINPDFEAVLKKWILLAQSGKAQVLAEEMLQSIFSDKFLNKFKTLLLNMYKEISENELNRFITIARACMGFDVFEQLEKIKCPTFVIGAEDDKVVTGKASIETAKKINAEIYMYKDGYAHAVYDEASDYKEKIFEFLLRQYKK